MAELERSNGVDKRSSDFNRARDQLILAGKALFQSVKDFFNDSGPQWAAAIAYYSLLSTFPLLLAAASIAAYFVDPQWVIDRAAGLLGNYMPGGSDRIRQIVQEAFRQRGSISLLSIAVLLWSGSRVFGVVTKALNIAYDVGERYGFIQKTLIELLMMMTIGVLFILALASRFLIDVAMSLIRIPAIQSEALFQILELAVPAVLLLISVFLSYQYVPRRKVDWRAALAGAAFFTAIFLLARPLFINYIRTFANYNLVYGSLAVVVTLVIWVWIGAALLLLGGEIVSHIQDMMIEQQPEEEVEARHKKRDPTRSGT